MPPNVNFAAGETDASFTVSVLLDDNDDDGESLHIGFGSLTEGVGIGRNSGKTINFRDNDGIDTWKVFFGESTCTATEGGASARMTVILGGLGFSY